MLVVSRLAVVKGILETESDYLPSLSIVSRPGVTSPSIARDIYYWGHSENA